LNESHERQVFRSRVTAARRFGHLGRSEDEAKFMRDPFELSGNGRNEGPRREDPEDPTGNG